MIRARNTGRNKEGKIKERKKEREKENAVCWTAPVLLDEEIEFLSTLKGGA